MNKRKRENDDDSSDDDMGDIDMNEMLDSEEEYSENEREMLEKVRQKRRPENYDSEDEVLGFSNEEYEDEEEKDSLASDIENLDENFDLPNEKAWGKKKKAYYSTDYVDADYSSTNQKDIADAELEEQEARNLQKQLAEQLDEADFGLDLIVSKDDSSEFDKGGEHIKADLSKLSKRQKQELLEKESPEFMPLVTDFQDRLTEAKTILGPFLDLIEKHNCYDSPASNFIRTKYDLLLHYCTNISFYLMLKAKREPIASHPVIKRLAQYRQLINQFEERQGNLLNEVEAILEANKNGKPLYTSINLNENIGKDKREKIKDLSSKHKKSEIMFEGDSSMDEIENELEQVSEIEGDDQDENETEKRAITYQIAKNKGLTPHRKKEQRNPRVKHRNKYRKAQIRRRGAIREVRKETTRYGGEISGIKASVKKSIKLK